MKLFTFEQLSQILELRDTDRMTDEMIFNSTYSFVEKYIGFCFEEKNYQELQTVRDSKVFLNQPFISDVSDITNLNTKVKVDYCVVDHKPSVIHLLTSECDGHVLFINYNAGFTTETFPAELKEAIIKLFIIKKNDFLNKLGNQENEDFVLPDDIKSVCNIYRRKSL